MQRKPILAVVPLGHAVYFEQFSGLREELTKKAEQLKAYLDDSTDLVVLEYVDTVDKAYQAVQSVKRMDADGILLLLTTYLPSAVAAPFAVYLDAPLILVGIQPLNHLDYERCTTFMQLVNDDVCAMPEIAGAIVRLGRTMPPCVVAAAGQTSRIEWEMRAWQRAVAAKAAFKYAKIGYLGHTYEGMYDMHTDPTAFTGAFGSHVQMLEMCELVRLVDEAETADVQRKAEEIRRVFSIQEPSQDPLTDFVQREDVDWAARVACALDRLVERNGLSGLAYYYKGEANLYEKVGASLIIGNTLLTSRGIPLAGEADLKTCAAMLIMNRLGGGGSFAEIHPFDVEDDCVLIGHDGPHNIAISEGQPILRKLKKYHGKAGSGIGVEFSIRSGPLTLLSMSVKADGKFKLVAAAGVSVKGRIPQTGNTNTRVKFDLPVTEFLRRWCEAGPTHHMALGVGNHLRAIRHFARMTNLDLEIITGNENA
ncbi:MAG TPA: L-fucose/L-arabinose isomerase family protein [Clostridia bacterium]|nr:L-fucose/L-arabinose isomerase family protein [Clostridia bacterium]